jgi:scyllo-inositol 2-dehydrogenase (NADP+)
MTRAGIVGFGLAGRHFHAPLLQAANIEIAAVVSSQREAIQQALPGSLALASAEELFVRRDIDLVVIATPNHLHQPQARAALEAGKHVVIDKPMCVHAAECDELIELARRQGRMLTAFQNRRWDADFLTIQRLVADGKLGELVEFHARWDRYRPTVVDRWREQDGPGSGVLYDLGAHLIDQVLVLLGMPDWIHADVSTQRPGGRTDDSFAIQMSVRGVRVCLGASMMVADGGARYRIHGKKGSYIKYGLDVQESQLRAGMPANDARFGVEPESQWGRLTQGATGQSELVFAEGGRWIEFYARARACIENGSEPPVSAESARDVIRVMEAALESSLTGRRIEL